MNRRAFLASSSTLILAAAVAGPALGQGLVAPFARVPRIAFGGIAGECSTYSRLRVTVPEMTVLRGQELADSERFTFLKRYDVPFLPTIVAQVGSAGPDRRAIPVV